MMTYSFVTYENYINKKFKSELQCYIFSLIKQYLKKISIMYTTIQTLNQSKLNALIICLIL